MLTLLFACAAHAEVPPATPTPTTEAAPDVFSVYGGVGAWSGDSVRVLGLAAGGNVALKHHAHVFELGHDLVAELFHDDEALNHRTTLLYGRRKEWTYGLAYAAMDGSVGLGLGPDRTASPLSSTALGAVVQARLSLGTRHFGVQGRALGMLGTAPVDGACTVGAYIALPLD